MNELLKGWGNIPFRLYQSPGGTGLSKQNVSGWDTGGWTVVQTGETGWGARPPEGLGTHGQYRSLPNLGRQARHPPEDHPEQSRSKCNQKLRKNCPGGMDTMLYNLPGTSAPGMEWVEKGKEVCTAQMSVLVTGRCGGYWAWEFASFHINVHLKKRSSKDFSLSTPAALVVMHGELVVLNRR